MQLWLAVGVDAETGLGAAFPPIIRLRMAPFRELPTIPKEIKASKPRTTRHPDHESLQRRVRSDFGEFIAVTSRQSGTVFQVEFPAFLGDGDAAAIFIEHEHGGNGYVVTDLAQTLTRLSCTRDDVFSVLEQLSELAERQGFLVDNGAIRCEVSDKELMGAILGLAQIEACAGSAIGPSTMRALRAEEFRSIVTGALRSLFGADMQENYHSPADPNGIYSIDAVLNLGKLVAVVTISSDLEAERAIVNKHCIAQSGGDIKMWIAVPKDINRLGRRTRTRLMQAYIALPEFDSETLKQRIIDVAG